MIEFDSIKTRFLVDTIEVGNDAGLIKTGYIRPNGNGEGDGWQFFNSYSTSYASGISNNGVGLSD